MGGNNVELGQGKAIGEGLRVYLQQERTSCLVIVFRLYKTLAVKVPKVDRARLGGSLQRICCSIIRGVPLTTVPFPKFLEGDSS